MDYQMMYVKKFARNIEAVAGEEVRREILAGCEELTSRVSKKKRAQAMKVAIERMIEMLPPEECMQIRERCACKPKKFLQQAQGLAREATHLEDLLEKLQRAGIIGNPLRLVGEEIHGAFGLGRCVCGMVGQSQELIPMMWCQCCKGHIQWLFEQVLEKPIAVELTEAIIAGGDECRYIVRFVSTVERKVVLDAD